ncbi:MAG: hypothetical protein S4CHLAM102_06880 [Chlamydiia bacterium]|nr:hypothetical protein [Chlamydiia bacterium]
MISATRKRERMFGEPDPNMAGWFRAGYDTMPIRSIDVPLLEIERDAINCTISTGWSLIPKM